MLLDQSAVQNKKDGITNIPIKRIGKLLLKGLIAIIQIPLTIIYFIFTFLGGVISGAGWLFGTAVFGITIILWIFGQFDTWYQIAVALGISVAIVWVPGFITEYVGEGILFLKRALLELIL